MFLLILPSVDAHPQRLLFFHADPRPRCPFTVAADVDFEDFVPRLDEWSRETPPPPGVLARLKRSPTKFKAFRSELDVALSWDIVDGTAEVWSTWEAFMRSLDVRQAQYRVAEE